MQEPREDDEMIGRHIVWSVRYVPWYLSSPGHFLIFGTLGNIYTSMTIDARLVMEDRPKNVFCAAMLIQSKLMDMAVCGDFECFS